MPRGSKPGERRGGRQKGSRNTRTREIADRLSSKGITPLEVMVEAMMAHHKTGNLDDAARIAKDAAPYIHPRLQAIEHGGPNGGPIEMNINKMQRDAAVSAALRADT